MCGITGILYKDKHRKVDQELLISMRDCMTHRGPDEKGIYQVDNLGLAHRRLSIIGLSTGTQPMLNAEETLCIVYNGEIYNYRELRQQLERKNYQFRTESDTEVIIHLYSEYGKDCVHHLNGMFAFAIWDARSKTLFLARDRLGIKPLYYADTPEAFVFASEIKSVLASQCIPSKCNQSAVYEYFLFRAVTGEQTLFEGVRSLLPGHRMFVTEKGIEIEKYWDHLSVDRISDIGFEQAVDKLKELLEDAVRIRLMSEVPLGTLCSGGVDSSLVTAMAARLTRQPVNTFSVGFYESDYDETEYARIVSREYKTNHHEIKISNRDFTDYLPEMITLNDEPLNFSNSIHIYAISKLAKDYVTVVLTGEGADELFLGYPRYQIPRLISYLGRYRRLFTPLLAAGSGFIKDHRLDKLSSYLNMDPVEILLLNAASSNPSQVNSLLNKEITKSLVYRKQVVKEMDARHDILARLSVQDQKTYLISILNRQDKMSMGASIEARVPFLDYRVVEFANEIASSSKIKRFNTKLIVKKVAEDYLPQEVIYRRKSGFGVPMAKWFRERNGLGGVTERLVNEGRLNGYLNKEMLVKLFYEHKKEQADHSEILWTTVNFLLWKEQYAIA